MATGCGGTAATRTGSAAGQVPAPGMNPDEQWLLNPAFMVFHSDRMGWFC